MSGPLSTDEIEDVVSSVRRLVSAEERPRPMTRDLAQDRLVLEPAFRIVPEASASVEPLLLTTPLKDVEPVASGPAPDPEMPAVADLSQTFEAEWEEELWTQPDPPLAELALGAEEAELLPEVELLPEAELLPEVELLPEAEVLHEVKVQPEVAAGPVEDAAVLASDPKPEGSPWGEVGDDWLDDDPAPAQPSAAAAASEAEAKSAGRPDVLKLSAEDMLTDGDGNPLTVLDEAALQQIIRQLIRDELKGVLGERITQSVRKLVRAEINRALAAHSLD